MKDVTPMLNWTARETYDAEIHSFVVPEGAQVDPTGHYVFSTGDLGNGVQEAEIVKMFRLLIGVDDNQPQRLRIIPRMPYGWNEIAVSKYPAFVEQNGIRETALLHYDLRRTGRSMTLDISTDRPLGPISMRLGPFQEQPAASDVLVNGEHPLDAQIAQSGDSWWVSFTTPIGPAAAAVAK
jgi:hypothetical protein